MMESSFGGVGDATSPGVLRQGSTLGLAVRVCLSLDNSAGAMGALVISCWHSAVLVFGTWNSGGSWCPCGGSTACLQEEGASLAGGEIGQHSWGDWPSSGEWGWLGEAGSVSALFNLCI